MKNRKSKFNTDVLSSAIRQAIKDMIACDDDPNYVINFSTWHHLKNLTAHGNFNAKGVNICEVCFAGSIMARNFEIPISKEITPSSKIFTEAEANMFMALNEIRGGNLKNALTAIDKELPRGLQEKYAVNEYDFNVFVRQMNQMADRLENKGL